MAKTVWSSAGLSFQVGLPSILLSASLRKSLVCRAKTEQEPKVKSSYYKRPSAAIERGGGFYVPGFRGYKLRTAVGSFILLLLALNHLSAGKSTSSSFLISERIAASSAIAVLLSAAYSAWTSAAEDRAIIENALAPTAEAFTNGASKTETSDQSTATREAWTGEQEFDWASSTLMDLAKASAVVLVRDGNILLNRGRSKKADVGQIVERVAKENKDIYIEDSSTLPEGVNFPFIQDQRAAASVHSLAGGKAVFVVARGIDDAANGFDKRDRMWIQQMAKRIESVL